MYESIDPSRLVFAIHINQKTTECEIILNERQRKNKGRDYVFVLMRSFKLVLSKNMYSVNRVEVFPEWNW